MDNLNRVIFYFIHFETGPYYEGLTDLKLTNENQAGLDLTELHLPLFSERWLNRIF